MRTTRLRLAKAPEAALAEVLALNEAVEELTAPLDVPRLGALVARALFAEARVAGDGRVAGFLIGFDPAAAYDSPNFDWFRARLHEFAYVDRVVIAPWAQGAGIARALYSDFADAARARGLTRLVCEVNRVPPNPGSDAFHAALGFVEVGQGMPLPGKLVRYLALPLEPAARG
jgi:predicted GNAT superfamily acetyltransferase